MDVIFYILIVVVVALVAVRYLKMWAWKHDEELDGDRIE